MDTLGRCMMVSSYRTTLVYRRRERAIHAKAAVQARTLMGSFGQPTMQCDAMLHTLGSCPYLKVCIQR